MPSSGRPHPAYSRFFTTLALGLFLLWSGLTGYELRHLSGLRFIEDPDWVEPPIWWQITAGAAMLGAATIYYRKLPALPDQKRSV